MSESPSEDEIPLPGGLGLHRGRRVLAGCLVGGLLIWAGVAAQRRVSESSAAPQELTEAPAPEPEPDVVALVGKPAVALRPAPPKRRSKAARMVSARTPAPVEREAVLSAPPAPERAPVAIPAPEVAVAVRETAPPPPPMPEPEAEQPPAPEPAVEATDDGNGEAIARAIAAEKRGAVQACFERELKRSPTLTGTLVVELDLAPPHRVNGVRVTDDLERPDFTQCVSSTMEHLSFGALNEEISVRVPYVLSARAK